MAIDYVIDYDCVPKQTLTPAGILARLKGRDQAHSIIRLFRQNNDNRPIDDIGFEFTRNTPDGEESHIVMVKDLLDTAAELDPLAHHCEGCPANIWKRPFGCMDRVNYPISLDGEKWLLVQLPTPDQAPLPWMLLREDLRDLNLGSEQVKDIRTSDAFFESDQMPRRMLGEIAVSGNNIFYMFFLMGHIEPSRAAVLLMLFAAMKRNLDAPDMLKLTPAPDDAKEAFPFQHKITPADERTTREMKSFLFALYTAWTLNVRVLLDV